MQEFCLLQLAREKQGARAVVDALREIRAAANDTAPYTSRQFDAAVSIARARFPQFFKQPNRSGQEGQS